MFLATTALSDFWDKDKEILFLGAWCLRYDKRSEWESLTYQVLPSPWDDRERFHQVAEYLEGSYERILGQLTEYLNGVHRVSLGERYWRILLGPWLLHHLHSFYDRYIHLSEAFKAHPDLDTITLEQSCFKTPKDTSQFIHFLTGQPYDDIYNLQIFSQLLHSMGRVDRVQKSEFSAAPSIKSTGWRPAAKAARGWGLGLVKKAVRTAVGMRFKIGLYDMYASSTATWKLAWKTGFRAIPIDLKDDWEIPERIKNGSRSGLANLESIDEFESSLIEWLPQNFPTLYLEGFENARKATNKKSTHIPPVVVSSIGWYHNGRFQFLAAEASQRGNRTVTVQHGGGYGIAEYSPLELHEAAISDSYMVWGWADDHAGPYQNLPGLKIPHQQAKSVKKKRSGDSGPLVFVATSHPRYLHRIQSQPVVGQWEGYINWSLRFMEAVSEDIRPRITFRPYPADYGWYHQERMSDRYPDIRCDSKQSFHKLLDSCSLTIIDHPSTTFLETLAANVPTVLFWDPDLWEFRDEALPYFRELSRTGVLWQSPEEAAEHVERIQEDPWVWWGSTEVQEARLHFSDRFALARNDWADCWSRALKYELAQSRIDV